MADAIEWCSVVWQTVGAAAESEGSLFKLSMAALPAVAGIAGIVIGQKTLASAEVKSVRAALLAEVEAIHDMCVIRQYVDAFREDAEYFRSPEGKKRQERGEGFKNHIPATDINLIYRANLNRLGGLSRREAKLIVRFHQLIGGVLQDVSEGGVLYEGSNDPNDYDEAVQILEQALLIAKDLMIERTPWWSIQRLRGQNVDTETKGKAGE
ncbi:hypothetical protein ACP9OK_01610 [Pseudomonas sp. B11]